MEKASSTPSGESYRICPICEAACGLRVSIDDGQVTGIRPNDEDVFSTGHVCAKGIALTDLHRDPDRLRTPLVRRDGELQPTSWAGAFSYINSRLASVRAEGGNDAIALYVGNPTAHNIGLSLGIGPLAMGLGTSKVFTAASVDQLPKHLASELMFGNGDAIPVPDIQRADLIVMLGSNPVVSNGSLWVVPKFRDKLRDFKARGGILVTIDPRRNETARRGAGHRCRDG